MTCLGAPAAQVMLIGLAGCGKTQSCTGLLKKLNPEARTTAFRAAVRIHLGDDLAAPR